MVDTISSTCEKQFRITSNNKISLNTVFLYLSPKRKYTLEHDFAECTISLKFRIECLTGIEIEKQALFVGENEMLNEKPLNSYFMGKPLKVDLRFNHNGFFS